MSECLVWFLLGVWTGIAGLMMFFVAMVETARSEKWKTPPGDTK